MSRKLSVVLDETSPAQLLKLLVDGQMVEADGWVLSAEDNAGSQATHFWVTSPYGVDCAYVPLTDAGAERIHTMIVNHVDQGELEHF